MLCQRWSMHGRKTRAIGLEEKPGHVKMDARVFTVLHVVPDTTDPVPKSHRRLAQ